MGRFINSYFQDTSDVYVGVNCWIDGKKHVKPLAVNPVAKSNLSGESEVDQIIKNYDGKMKTISKYSYYEASNQKWVKAVIAVDGIKDVPKENLKVVFGDRTLDIFVKDYGKEKDQILHFGCRKLQWYIVPEECKWAVKSDGIQVSLKKKNIKDNWWSFFKQKATGEVDSDLEDN